MRVAFMVIPLSIMLVGIGYGLYILTQKLLAIIKLTTKFVKLRDYDGNKCTISMTDSTLTFKNKFTTRDFYFSNFNTHTSALKTITKELITYISPSEWQKTSQYKELQERANIEQEKAEYLERARVRKEIINEVTNPDQVDDFPPVTNENGDNNPFWVPLTGEKYLLVLNGRVIPLVHGKETESEGPSMGTIFPYTRIGLERAQTLANTQQDSSDDVERLCVYRNNEN